jgi:hypothetical protein
MYLEKNFLKIEHKHHTWLRHRYPHNGLGQEPQRERTTHDQQGVGGKFDCVYIKSRSQPCGSCPCEPQDIPLGITPTEWTRDANGVIFGGQPQQEWREMTGAQGVRVRRIEATQGEVS